MIAFATGEGKKDVDLNVDLEYSGAEITIKNNDLFIYKNARMKLNDDYILEGYDIDAGSTYTVGMGQFTDSDGNRFNFFTMKPRSFSISCEVDDGQRGWFYGETR